MAAPSASSPPWRRRFQRPISACGNAGSSWLWVASADGAARRRMQMVKTLSTFGRAMAAPSASLPPWRRRLRRPISACGIAGWLLAADRGGWRCLAIASAVWDCVGGRRSQHRHRGKTWFAADYGELLCIAQRLRCDTSSKEGVNDNLFCWHDGGDCMRGWCNVMLSSGGRGSSVSRRVLGNRATLFFILAATL